MKQICRFFSIVAMAALAFSACTEELNNDNINGGKTVTVHFGTENTDPASTKATLTPNDGETAFQAAWENGDAIKVEYSNDSKSETATGTTTATWNGTSFESKMPEYTGMWIYDAAYPVPSESDSSVDFGPNRTQKGNAYNSKYDIMIGSAVAENAAAGKDKTGKDIVFMMTRQTAIAYFHFTSELDEAVTSATLKVTDGAIANSSASINEQFKFVAPQENDLTEINLTFEEGTAPSAKDFQLWFNVLPTTYNVMTLTVETSSKSFTIKKDTKGKLDMYEAGQLYKVKKSDIAWTDKAVTPSGPTITKITSASDFTAGTYIIMTYDESYYVPNAAATNAGPELGNVVKTDGVITITPEMIWNATVSGEGLEFTSYLEPDKKLWGAPKSDGVRVNKTITANNPSSIWKLEAIDKYGLCGYAGVSGTDKYYLSTYGTKDWRNYKTSNISETNKAANFFKVEGWVDSNHSISIATVDGGTLSASPRSAAEGTEVTLTATPDEGYVFNDDWTVTNAETAEKITVKDGKFTMPAANVTVSASFTQKTYAITANTAENGTYTVKVGDAEVTSAVKGAKVVLEATPDEGYIHDGWTVLDAKGKSVSVSNDSFYMPASAVTISTSFSLKPEDITYDHAGTAEDPYSVADVLKYISTLGTATSTEDVYVKGIISSISEVSTSYGNATYFIKDEGIENEVKVFRGLYLNGAKFTSADQIAVGDEVVVKGKVKNYNDTPEFDAGNSLVSILKVSASKTSIDAAGETVTITVDTNVDSWNATSDNADFVVGTPSDNTVNVVVSENKDDSERTATITVKAGTLSKTITLTQSAAGTVNKFSQTYSYGDLTAWSLTEYTDKSSYYLIPSGDNPSVATISGIFKDKTIQSDVVITLNVATFGSGTNPSASTFSIYADSDLKTSVTATQSGTLPTSSTYTNAVYTVKQDDAASLISDLAIKITKPGKQIRLKSIKIEFSYSK